MWRPARGHRKLRGTDWSVAQQSTTLPPRRIEPRGHNEIVTRRYSVTCQVPTIQHSSWYPNCSPRSSLTVGHDRTACRRIVHGRVSSPNVPSTQSLSRCANRPTISNHLGDCQEDAGLFTRRLFRHCLPKEHHETVCVVISITRFRNICRRRLSHDQYSGRRRVSPSTRCLTIASLSRPRRT